MDVCDAMVAKEMSLWRYVKHELNTLAWASLILVTFLLVRKLCAVLRLLAMGYRLPGPPARALNGQSKCLSAAQGPHMLQGWRLVALRALGYVRPLQHVLVFRIQVLTFWFLEAVSLNLRVKIIECFNDLLTQEYLYADLLARLHHEHGPVVKIWTGPAQLLVSINDVHILQRMLEHAKDRISAPRVALQLVYGQRSLFFSKYSKVGRLLRSFGEQYHRRGCFIRV